MDIKTIIFHTSICFFTLTSAFSQNADIKYYSFKECISEAIANNLQIKKSKIETQERLSQLNEQKTNYLPQVNGYINYFNYFNDLPIYIFPESEGQIISGGNSEGPYPVPLGLQNNLHLGIDIEQYIFHPDYISSKSFHQHIERINQLSEELIEQEIIYKTARLFLNIIETKEKQLIIDFNLNRLEKLDKLVETRIENDMATISESKRIRLNKLSAENKLSQLHIGINKQKTFLKFLMGIPPEQNKALADDNIVRQVEDVDMDNSQNLQSELLTEQRYVLDLKSKQINNKRIPTLKAFINLNYQSPSQSFDFFSGNPEWYGVHMFGLGLDIPIFNGQKTNRQIDGYSISMSKNRIEKALLEQNHQAKYVNAIAAYELSKSLLKEAELKLEFSEEDLALNRKKYETDLINIVELLDSESEAIDKEMQFTSQKVNKLAKELDLLFLTGNIDTLLNK